MDESIEQPVTQGAELKIQDSVFWGGGLDYF